VETPSTRGAKPALLVALMIGAGIAAAPASADPQDLVPYCSGDQSPMDSNCRSAPSQIATHEGSGLSPDLPSGLTPDTVPVI
jgi:hypothetical protein